MILVIKKVLLVFLISVFCWSFAALLLEYFSTQKRIQLLQEQNILLQAYIRDQKYYQRILEHTSNAHTSLVLDLLARLGVDYAG